MQQLFEIQVFNHVNIETYLRKSLSAKTDSDFLILRIVCAVEARFFGRSLLQALDVGVASVKPVAVLLHPCEEMPSAEHLFVVSSVGYEGLLRRVQRIDLDRIVALIFVYHSPLPLGL